MRIFLSHTPDMRENYYGARALAALRTHGDVVLNETGRVLDDAQELADLARGAQIVVADRQTPAPAAFFDSAPALLAFCRVAVDIRNIDVAAASRNGVLVTRATPGFADAVAELGFGLMIDLARGISDSVCVYRGGQAPKARMGRQLRGATLGIIGYGIIGERMSELAQAFGMRVLVSDPFKNIPPPAEPRPLPDLLGEADFVVCLAVANEATEKLMDQAAFGRMRENAYFINLSRGNLVDEAALARALDEVKIAGAAMDVGRAPDQMPSLALAARYDVIATPHIGGLTPQSAEHQAFDTVRQVAALVAGEVPFGAVNTDAKLRLLKG